MFGLLILSDVILAFANGANDNMKGVASLCGCRVASYKSAPVWTTVTTFAGSVGASC